ncbi:MAG: FecR family protein [Planctomycetota bacterium]|jgi:Spy/CpxP family protein refolding chaperone
MTSDWREVLSRFLDGEELGEAEAKALADALGKDDDRPEAKTWLLLEAALQARAGDRSTEEVVLSRERLLAKVILREKRRDIRRSRPGGRAVRRKVLAMAAAAAVLVGAFATWLATAYRYPPPRVTGSFEVVGGGRLGRGSTIRTREKPATVVSGGYCRIDVGPRTALRIEGEKRKERVFLLSGSVTCEVEREAGSFAVRTDAGTASVAGTRFTVRIVEEQEPPGRMFVKVLAGRVLLKGTWGERALAEGQEATVPERAIALPDETVGRATASAKTHDRGGANASKGKSRSHLSASMLRQRLGLDEDTARKLAELCRKRSEALRDIWRTDRGGKKDAKIKLMRELRKKSDEEIAELLTPDQLREFEKTQDELRRTRRGGRHRGRHGADRHERPATRKKEPEPDAPVF